MSTTKAKKTATGEALTLPTNDAPASEAEREKWIPFSETPPPSKERFAYCRELETGNRVAAFAEVSEGPEGPGLFVDGLSGFHPLPTTTGHWWRLVNLPE